MVIQLLLRLWFNDSTCSVTIVVWYAIFYKLLLFSDYLKSFVNLHFLVLHQDVSVLFNNVTACWKKVDYINAYEDNRCWSLQIRKRRGTKRTTINNGWKFFCQDMGLEEGDVCVFHWKNDSFRNFDIEIQKAVGRIP